MPGFNIMDVPENFMPHGQYHRLLWKHVIQTRPPLDGWWYGWCPLHDPDGSDPDQPTAEFNFFKGVMRCLGDPDLGCHEMRTKGAVPKRKTVISLVNLLTRMAVSDAERS